MCSMCVCARQQKMKYYHRLVDCWHTPPVLQEHQQIVSDQWHSKSQTIIWIQTSENIPVQIVDYKNSRLNCFKHRDGCIRGAKSISKLEKCGGICVLEVEERKFIVQRC